jgi:hypothetical protein
MFDLSFAPVNTWRPPPLDEADPDIELWRDTDGTICAYGGSRDGMCWMHLPRVATFRFSQDSSRITAIAETSVPHGMIVDAYYRTILPMALQAHGIEVLHASAVRMCGGIVALCGIKETGKSTIAYALSQRGYSLRADDAVPFATNLGAVSVLSVPFSIRLRAASAAFFQSNKVKDAKRPLPDPQTPLTLSPEPLVAVFVLGRHSDRLSIAPPVASRLTSSTAFMSALTHGYCFSLRDQARRERMVRNYLDLASRVPVFDLRFAPGLAWLPAITNAIEAALAATAG